MKVCSLSSVIAVVVALVGTNIHHVESTPWNDPFRSSTRMPMMKASTTLSSSFRKQPTWGGVSSAPYLKTRGGADQPIPVDSSSADSTKVASLSETMARGGSSTITKKRPLEADVTTAMPSSTSLNADTTTTTTTFQPVVTFVQNSTTSTTAAEGTALTQLDKSRSHIESDRKRHKRHKSIAKKLKNRNHVNFRRKIFHASSGIVFAALNHLIPKAKFVPAMTVLTSATLLMELLRYRKGFGWMNDILHFCLGDTLRKHEMDGKFTGSFYFFWGVTMTAALYPQSCATLGILQLAIADPTASYFGRQTRHVYWSRIENGLGGFGRNKGVLGFLGGALACVPMNYRLLSLAQFGGNTIPGGKQALLTASMALGLAGAFADLAVPTPTLTLPKRVCGVRVPPFHVDDNFVVPIFSGYACTKVFKALSWSSDLALSKFMVV